MRFILLVFLLCSCSGGYLLVEREKVNSQSLASSKVGSPDPRKKSPPKGERLLVSWYYPKSIFDQKLRMEVVIRLWDLTEECFTMDLDYKTGSKAFYIEDKTKDQRRRILTYLIQVKNEKGDLIEKWHHHFWTKKIVP